MSHITNGIDLISEYIRDTILDNMVIKFILSGVIGIMTSIYSGNEKLIFIVFLLFIIDWILGVSKAIKFKVFSSRGFFKGAYKLLVYGGLILIGYGLDEALYLQGNDVSFLSIMFAFIAITDVSSILENLEDLGYSQYVPSFLRRVLNIHRNKYFTDKIKDITGYDISNKYLDDLNQIENYINHIPDPDYKALFKIKIVYLRRIIMDLIDTEVYDIDTFKHKIDLLFINVGSELDIGLLKSGVANLKITKFMESHKERFGQLTGEIQEVLSCDCETLTQDEKKKALKQVKENVIQTIIRIVYKNVSDKFKT